MLILTLVPASLVLREEAGETINFAGALGVRGNGIEPKIFGKAPSDLQLRKL